MTSPHLRLALTGLALLALSARPPRAEHSADSRPAATVNGEVITLAELDEAVGARLAAMPDKSKLEKLDRRASARFMDRLQWVTLRELVSDRLQAQAVAAAQKAGAVSISQAALNSAVAEARKTYPTNDEFRQAHPTVKSSRDQWVHRQLLQGALMRKLTQGVNATEREARQFYQRYSYAFKDKKTGKVPRYENMRESVLRSALVKKKMDRAKDWRKGLWREGKVEFHVPVPERL